MKSNLQHIDIAIRYIEQHLREPLRAEDVAAEVNFSYSYFHRVFYALTGETIGDYIRKRRLSEAARELLFSERSILDIAVDFHFESQEAFSRSFKSFFCLPPATFRKQRMNPAVLEKQCLLGTRLEHRLAHISLEPCIVNLAEPIAVIGIEGRTSLQHNRLPELWKSFLHLAANEPAMHEPYYSICIPEPSVQMMTVDETSEFAHFIGARAIPDTVAPLGMSQQMIRSGKYALFRHLGTVRSLRDTYAYIWGTWLPNSAYSWDEERFDFEQYGADYIGHDHEESIIWIHIPVRAQK
ncbi:helix-turn-helix domain-containing protein [Paenibacillus sp. 481]|uniref:helix-turn-helix domain-containing protein n=1 Tax=Paenibacillus sp. 481 TaxID=2835869 RepID=UPI001E4E982A|nr:helix-turn-helix domain-containing protein [Paenibacillus sp. 481]UHA73566.1 AraC family transcriptional regulator [Paenibacillus sp. 481]